MFAIASIILLASGNALAESSRKLGGGAQIARPNFTFLPNPMPSQQGPFFSSELSCRMRSFQTPYFYAGREWDAAELGSAAETYAEAVLQSVPDQMLPYVEAVKALNPVRSISTKRFPQNFSAFMYSGVGLVGNGSQGCGLEEGLAAYQTCEDWVGVANKIPLELPPAYLDEAYRNKGLKLSLGDFTAIWTGFNPQFHENYQHALEFMTTGFLQDDCFFERSEQEIQKFLQDLHKILLNKLPDPSDREKGMHIPGQFRKGKKIIYKYDHVTGNPERDAEVRKNLKQKAGLSEEELDIFFRGAKKLAYGPNFEQMLDKEEKAVWSKVTYFPSSPDQIEPSMKGLIANFKKYAKQDLHPVALAAWFHCEFVRILPFCEKNGTLARLVMNGILVRGGYEPVIITDESAYIDAVADDKGKPGTFAKYLAGLARQQLKGPQVLIRANSPPQKPVSFDSNTFQRVLA